MMKVRNIGDLQAPPMVFGYFVNLIGIHLNPILITVSMEHFQVRPILGLSIMLANDFW